ncbi:MAG: Signal peptidase I, partial [uncultured Acidimicrobiales bacterium]
ATLPSGVAGGGGRAGPGRCPCRGRPAGGPGGRRRRLDAARPRAGRPPAGDPPPQLPARGRGGPGRSEGRPAARQAGRRGGRRRPAGGGRRRPLGQHRQPDLRPGPTVAHPGAGRAPLRPARSHRAHATAAGVPLATLVRVDRYRLERLLDPAAVEDV